MKKNRRIYQICIVVLLLVSGMSLTAQNAKEMRFITINQDSNKVLDERAYIKELRKSGMSREDAERKAKGLKMELRIMNEIKNQAGGGGGMMMGMMSFSEPERCWSDEGNLFPGEIPFADPLVNPDGDCCIDIPTQVPTCGNDNFGFESGDFTGWIGRTGKFIATQANSACSPAPALDINTSYAGTAWSNYNPISNRFVINKKISSGASTFPLDFFGNFPVVEPGENNNYSARLGSYRGEQDVEQLIYFIKITPDNHFLSYKYAVVLEDPGQDHQDCHKPSFAVELFETATACSSWQKITCGSMKMVYADNLPGFKRFALGEEIGIYKDWTTQVVDLGPVLNGASEKTIMIRFTTTDCAFHNHFGFAYVDGVCSSNGLAYSGDPCTGSALTFYVPESNVNDTYQWYINNSPVSGATQSSFKNAFQTAGTYQVKCIVQSAACSTAVTLSSDVIIEQCLAEKLQCEDDCIGSFAPLPNHKYLLGAWVRENNAPADISFEQPKIRLHFTVPACSTCSTMSLPCSTDVSSSLNYCTYEFSASGPIIDGWQRLEQTFIVPDGATEMFIEMVNTHSSGSSNYVFFDDIRIFPFDGAMKSYVYDPVSQKLLAELDDNNYATFYEYDEEGSLVRVKKETERGVKTIKESMSNTRVKP